MNHEKGLFGYNIPLAATVDEKTRGGCSKNYLRRVFDPRSFIEKINATSSEDPSSSVPAPDAIGSKGSKA